MFQPSSMVELIRRWRPQLLRLVVGLSVLLGLTIGLAGPPPAAYADDPTPTPTATPDPSQDESPSDPILQSAIDKKQALVNLYAQVGRGEISMATYNAALDDFYAADQNKELHHPDYGQSAAECAAIPLANLAYLSDGTCYDVTEGTFTGPVPTNNAGPATNTGLGPVSVMPRYRQRILYQVPQIPQDNGYYCGPAAAAEVLRFWQVAYNERSTSYYGDTFSQSSLGRQCQSWEWGCRYAQGKFLMTDSNGTGGTNWRWRPYIGGPNIYMMEWGLNFWREGREHASYVPIGLPQEDITFMRVGYFSDRWITDIDAAFPMIADASENMTNRGVTSSRLPGHPTNRVIKHWFAIRGYSTPSWYGDNHWWVHYVDSVWASTLNNTNGYGLTQGNNKVELFVFHKMLEVDGFGYVW